MRSTAALLLSLFAVCPCILRIEGKCDAEVVKKIKGMNVDSTDILDKLSGEYAIVYVEASQMGNADYNGRCIKINFFREGTKYKLEYKIMMQGKRTLKKKADGGFVHLGTEDEPELTYYPVVNSHDMFAAYVCSNEKYEEEDGVEEEVYGLSYVAVPIGRTLPGLPENVEEVANTMTSLGLPRGTVTFGCFANQAQPESGRSEDSGAARKTASAGCTIEQRSYHEIKCR